MQFKYKYVEEGVCMRAHACACVHACMHVCVCKTPSLITWPLPSKSRRKISGNYSLEFICIYVLVCVCVRSFFVDKEVCVCVIFFLWISKFRVLYAVG